MEVAAIQHFSGLTSAPGAAILTEEEAKFVDEFSFYAKNYSGLGSFEVDESVQIVWQAYEQSKQNPNAPVVVDFSGLFDLRFSPPLPPGTTIFDICSTQIKKLPKLPTSLIELHAFRSELTDLPDDLHEGIKIINIRGTNIQEIRPINLPDSITAFRVPLGLIDMVPAGYLHAALNPEQPMSAYETLMCGKY